MKIFIGADHVAGFKTKKRIICFLKTQGHAIVDVGWYKANNIAIIRRFLAKLQAL